MEQIRNSPGPTVVALTLICLLGFLCGPVASAELKPGEILSQQNWQQAEGLMPKSVLDRFRDGGYRATITTLPETLEWGSKFKAASEGNAGQFSVDTEARLIDTSTHTYPTFLYGYPFPHIDPQDPQAASKVMYNFAYTLMQADDAERVSNRPGGQRKPLSVVMRGLKTLPLVVNG